MCRQAHVLRYWEQEFSQLKPLNEKAIGVTINVKMLLVRQIRSLLYEQGFTIEGARKKLQSPETPNLQVVDKLVIHQLINDLEEVLLLLDY